MRYQFIESQAGIRYQVGWSLNEPITEFERLKDAVAYISSNKAKRNRAWGWI